MLVRCSSCRHAKVNAGADRCQIQSQGVQSAIPTSCFHWQSCPILTLNFKDSIKDASALCRTALVITAKQKKSDLMSVLSRDQSVSKSQQTLLSSRWCHHQNRVLHPALSSFLSGLLCSCPHVALTDLFSIRSALQPLFNLLRKDGFPLHWGLISWSMKRRKWQNVTEDCYVLFSKEFWPDAQNHWSLLITHNRKQPHTPHWAVHSCFPCVLGRAGLLQLLACETGASSGWAPKEQGKATATQVAATLQLRICW